MENPALIYDNLLDVNGKPCVNYTLSVSEIQDKVFAKRNFLLLVRMTFTKF